MAIVDFADALSSYYASVLVFIIEARVYFAARTASEHYHVVKRGDSVLTSTFLEHPLKIFKTFEVYFKPILDEIAECSEKVTKCVELSSHTRTKGRRISSRCSSLASPLSLSRKS